MFDHCKNIIDTLNNIDEKEINKVTLIGGQPDYSYYTIRNITMCSATRKSFAKKMAQSTHMPGLPMEDMLFNYMSISRPDKHSGKFTIDVNSTINRLYHGLVDEAVREAKQGLDRSSYRKLRELIVDSKCNTEIINYLIEIMYVNNHIDAGTKAALIYNLFAKLLKKDARK